jgi:hypothetical protein
VQAASQPCPLVVVAAVADTDDALAVVAVAVTAAVPVAVVVVVGNTGAEDTTGIEAVDVPAPPPVSEGLNPQTSMLFAPSAAACLSLNPLTSKCKF